MTGAPAFASDRTFAFNLPAQGLSDSLLELAVQARTPLGGDLSACRGRVPAVRGDMSLRAALDRLLRGQTCTYVLTADRSIIIRRTPRPTRPASPPRPLSPVSESAAALATPDPVYPVAVVSEVVVTAQRRPASPQNAPVAVTSISAVQIQAANASDANDLSALVAGMTVTNLGAGRNKIMLRGMSDGAFTGVTQSTVGIYLNRAPLTYNAPDPDLKLIDLDRVEVLRGPQGTQYGAGPIGGILRLVPQAPDFLNETLQVSASRSQTRDGGANSDYWLVGNLPLPNGRGSVRAALYSEESGGYINDISLNLRRVNKGERRGGRLVAGLDLGQGWRLDFGGTRQRIATQDTHYVYRTLNGLRRANLVREPHLNDFAELHVSLEGRGDWGRLEAFVSHVEHDFDSRYDASVALRPFGSTGRIGALDEARRIDLTVGEVVYASPNLGRRRWLAGLFALTGRTASATDLNTLWPFRALTYAERRTDERQEIALFGELSYDLTPDLTLTAGTRLFNIDFNTRSRVVQDPVERLFNGNGGQGGLSPKLALDYHPRSDWTYYAEVTQGHRVGGFNTGGSAGQSFGGGVGTPDRRYDGDTLWNVEVGAKGRLWQGRVQTRLALFQAYWREIQSDQFLPSGLAYAVNVGDGANTGLEIEAKWRVAESLELRGNALFSDPEITEPSRNFNSRGDAGLPGVPAVSANVNLAWRRPWLHGAVLAVDANLAYVGASRLTFDAEKRHRMGDYVTGRVAAGISSDHWRVTAFVDNLFDTTANTFSFGDPFRLPEALAATPLRPRTVGLSVVLSH